MRRLPRLIVSPRHGLWATVFLSLPACALNKDQAASWESVFTIVGIVAAGAFFAFKAWQGYNNKDLSLTLSAERRRLANGSDAIAAVLVLERGPNAAIALLGAYARFKCVGISEETLTPIDLYRVTIEGTGKRAKVDWEHPDRSAPALLMSPRERSQFACYSEVPGGVPCLVEVLITGRRRANSSREVLGQWRASLMVLPPEERDRSPAVES